MKFRCFDVMEGPEKAQMYGTMPCAQLAASQPCALNFTDFKKGKSIEGLFLDTYYCAILSCSKALKTRSMLSMKQKGRGFAASRLPAVLLLLQLLR